MTALDRALRGTLGVVAGACWYEGRTGDARWVGVGNVLLRTFGTVEASLPGQDGLLGHAFPTPREQRVRLAPGDLLLLVTDGVRERLSVADYPGLLGDGAPLVARRVVERFGRDHDDVTCVSLRRGR
jgi:serine/threonine protein phosphatase PrpC